MRLHVFNADNNKQVAINPEHVAAIKELDDGKTLIIISNGDCIFTVKESLAEVHSRLVAGGRS